MCRLHRNLVVENTEETANTLPEPLPTQDGDAQLKRRRRRRRRKRRRPDTGTESPGSQIDTAARRLGIRQLYPEQKQVINTVLERKDALVVLPTGFGKSACYQIPSMVLDKPVLLISPLLALLRDQHEKLLKRDIPCARLDGTVRGKNRRETLERISNGGSLLVMTTPETLGGAEASEALRQSGVSMAAVDEAHCISEWGHDFRPAYIQLGERLRDLGAPPIMALTATATEPVREDIIRYLALREPEIVAGSPHRGNLTFEVIESRGDARIRALMRLSKRLRRPGIIYCSTTREVDNVYTALRLLRIPSHRYHGKMTSKERNSEQELFMKHGRRVVMVATSAFGLGIDKPDIRFIVHYQAPASLEQYVQEAGRAGRDGQKANCILLFDPDDRSIHEALLQKSRISPGQLYKVCSALAAWAGEGRTPTLDAFALSAGLGTRVCQALLAVLAEAGLVHIGDEVELLIPGDQIEEQGRQLAGQFETIKTQDSRRLDSIADYAQDPGCRAQMLRRYFGEESGPPCHVCDNCRDRPERPDSFWEPIATPEHHKKKKRGRRRKKKDEGNLPPGSRRGRNTKKPPAAPTIPYDATPLEPLTVSEEGAGEMPLID